MKGSGCVIVAIEQQDENPRSSIKKWLTEIGRYAEEGTPVIFAIPEAVGNITTKPGEEWPNNVKFVKINPSSKDNSSLMDAIDEMAIKPRIEDILESAGLTPVSIGYNHTNRFHVFKASLNSITKENLQFIGQDVTAKGDELKRLILEAFKKELDNVIDIPALEKAIQKIRDSEEFKIISSSQGITSRLFHIKTDSLKALEGMIHQRGEQLGQEHAEERLFSSGPS